MVDLLPPNATAQERAISVTLARLADVPVPIRDLWNPWTIPAELLPWLAWTLSIDEEWESARTDQDRRALVASAVELHRYKGTPYAIRRALAALGHTVASITEGLPSVRHDGAGRRDGGARYDGAARWALFRVAVVAGDAGLTRLDTGRIVTAIGHAKNARSVLHALRLLVNPETTRDSDPVATPMLRVGLTIPTRRVGIRDGTRRRGGVVALRRDGSVRYDGAETRAGRVIPSPVFVENSLRLRLRLGLRLECARAPYLPRDGSVRYDGLVNRRHDGPLSVLSLRLRRRSAASDAEVRFLVADPIAESSQLAAVRLSGPDGVDSRTAVTIRVQGHETLVDWAVAADAAPDLTRVSAITLLRQDGSTVCALLFDSPADRLPSDPWSGAWALSPLPQRDTRMTTTYLPAYYDGVRRLLTTGDPALLLSHVAFGEGFAPDADAITNPVLVPIGGIVYPPDEPKRMLVHWVLPHEAANGLMVREIGLLRADGVLVARMVRSAIEKTPDLEIGDVWKLDV
ncbi:phage tail protein I [Azospirillum cavernae]|uniref:Phage tail protein I n=1 Tax=Azospirillum cavernae TaxID=2320860 RepID=A0A418VVG6_9PROT|nr:phage tail protein I [Azospirillum cavernae]RJF81131.1 phage tail protein I [Azospirillum cavernae]